MTLRAPHGERIVKEDADALAASVLGFIAADPDRLAAFLDQSGLTPRTVRAAARAPGFTEAVLAHLASDERLLLGFSRARGRDPERIAALCRLASPEPAPDP